MNKKFYKRLYCLFIKPYLRQQIICFFLVVVYSILNIVFPVFFELIIDDAIGNRSVYKLVMYILIMIGIILLMILCKYFQIKKSVKLGQRIVLNIRLNIINKLSRYSKKFFNKFKVGDIVSIIENDVQNAEIISSSLINEFLVNILTAIVLFIIIFRSNVWIGLSAMALSIIYTLIQRIYGSKVKYHSMKVSSGRGQVLSIIQDFIGRMADIKMIDCGKLYLNKYENEQMKYFKDEYKLAVTTNNSSVVSTIFQSLGLVIILCLGGYMILKDKMTMGVLFSLSVYIQRVYAPIVALSNTYLNLKKAQASIDRICRLTDDTENLITDGEALLYEVKNIEAINLSFGYSDNMIISNGNLSINKGEKVAIVGANGSGKSTLVNLLLKIQEGYTGNIYVNHTDIKELSVKEIRRKIACISQDALIFNGTVRENIVLDNENITESEIEMAIKAVCLQDDIEKMEHGIDTTISEKELSGGQKQKIALARLFIKKPQVIILDEPTSALDLQSEKEICKNIYETFEGNTIISITHRPELLNYCDIIYEIEENRITKYQKDEWRR